MEYAKTPLYAAPESDKLSLLPTSLRLEFNHMIVHAMK